MAVLLPIWTEKAETARRVRQRISAVMKWAVAQGYRGDNPAGDAIAAALPKFVDKRRHFRAIHHTRAGDVIRVIKESQASPAARLAFEFLVLTAARSGEVRGASWYEFDHGSSDLDGPGRAHEGWTRASRSAIGIGRWRSSMSAGARRRERVGVSGSRPGGGPISDSTLSKLLRELDIDAVPHGFRSTFRDWCSESARVPREVAEACLAHAVKGVEGDYARSDLLDRRRKLMNRWAAFLATDAADTVIPMARPSREARQ